MVWVVWLLSLFIFEPSFAANGPKATLVFERADCIMRLEAAGGSKDLPIVLAVRETRKVKEVKMPVLEGAGWLKGMAIQMAANSFLAGQSGSQTESVPGNGVREERFSFGPVETKPELLRIGYDLQYDSKSVAGGEQASVGMQVSGRFTRGNWNDFVAGREVSFEFTPEGWKCVERVMGLRLDAGSSNLAERLYLSLQCSGEDPGIVAENRTGQALDPARFEGTRHRMEFTGPSSRVELTIGMQ